MLATNPPWRQNFIDQLNQQGLSPDAIFRLTAQDSARATAIAEQTGLLQTLVKNHEYERAYLAWVNFLPKAQLNQVGTIYDPGFANLPGPLPFNWQFTNDTTGSAEFRKPRGLTISYLGATQTTLATQILLLSPGRYRLSVVASGDDTYNQLGWMLSCTDGGNPLQTVQLTGLKTVLQRYSAAFEIPAANCGAQRLALTGSPGEFPRTAEAVVDTIQIEPAK
jgi:hypothetical protein